MGYVPLIRAHMLYVPLLYVPLMWGYVPLIWRGSWADSTASDALPVAGLVSVGLFC